MKFRPLRAIKYNYTQCKRKNPNFWRQLATDVIVDQFITLGNNVVCNATPSIYISSHTMAFTNDVMFMTFSNSQNINKNFFIIKLNFISRVVIFTWVIK